MRILIILLMCCVLCGCASMGLPPTNELIQRTNDDVGAVKTFNYPYKAVFFACEDAMSNCSAHPYLISESSVEEGYILASRRGEPVMCGSVMVLIEKIDSGDTMVKIRGFRDVRWQAFYKQFFKRVEINLERIDK